MNPHLVRGLGTCIRILTFSLCDYLNEFVHIPLTLIYSQSIKEYLYEFVHKACPLRSGYLYDFVWQRKMSLKNQNRICTRTNNLWIRIRTISQYMFMFMCTNLYTFCHFQILYGLYMRISSSMVLCGFFGIVNYFWWKWMMFMENVR